MKSSLVVPAKNVERWTSRRSRDRVVDRSEFVYFGVSMNLKPNPRTSREWGGTSCWSVRSWNAKLGMCSGVSSGLEVKRRDMAFWKED